MATKNKLFLLDAMALIYRAFYALNKNPRINSKGLNTSAILGFANTLFDVIKREKPTHIAVAFDTAVATQRHIDYTDYKAHRESMPEDLAISIPYIKSLIEAFNIPVIAVDGYEADDIVGTLAKKAESIGWETYMMTTDKDFGQLVSDNIFIYKPAIMGNKPEILGVENVCMKYGIKRPEQIKDLLGLWGDASDNIPGIPGVGEITAKKLIDEWDTIENLIANTQNIKNEKLKEKVIKYADQALMSKNLATIILDVPVELEEEKLKLKSPDKQNLKEIFDQLEFKTFAQRVLTFYSTLLTSDNNKNNDLFSELNEEGNITEEESSFSSLNNIKKVVHKYVLVDTLEKREQLIKELLSQKSICFDTETTGIDPNDCELVGISFAFKPHEAYFVTMPDNFDDALEIVKEFKPIFYNSDTEFIGQNIKYDISVLKWYDIEVRGKLFDTMLAHYLVDPDQRHNMDYMARMYLKYDPVPIEALIGKKGKGQSNMKFVDKEAIKEYSCEDADITLQLKQILEKELKELKSEKIFYDIEIPLLKVLSAIEAEGIKLDVKALNEYSIQLSQEIHDLKKEIYHLAGTNFNISSPKQLGEILFERLKIVDNAKLTKTKQYSTSEEVLVKLSEKHEIIQKILDYRSLTKLKSTYVDVLPQLINKRTGRLHTSYNQAVAATGRLSSNNPNLQNIPIRTEKGREIRKAFVSRNEDYVLLSADYSQIELRIIAEVSKDPGMLEAFENGLDIHTATAAKLYDVPLSEVTKDMRRKAKTVNFGIIYGISSFGLSERINIPRKEATFIINQYFEKYPGIKKYMDKTIEFAKENGYVETILGRRRYIKDINSTNAVIRGYAERNAINAPIQGSAADMIKIAMINIFNKLNALKFRTKMLLQVHDELIFDVHKSELDTLIPIIRNEMRNAIPMTVPIEVEIETGSNWFEAH
ncbi:MAG: DNA polymerase I [Bacteroidota bacterium]|nr:DNA polymerase I [Bacteroidota bacterium]